MTNSQPQYLTDAIESHWATLTNREYVPVRLSPRDIIDAFGIETAKETLKYYKEELAMFDRIEQKMAVYLFKQGNSEEEVIRVVNELEYDDEREWIAVQISRLEELIKLSRYKPIAGTIGDEEIRKAKAVSIENYLEFNRAGNAICLWHSDRKPSLHLYRQSNRCHCFSCGADKDSIDVVQNLQNCDFISAVKYILNK